VKAYQQSRQPGAASVGGSTSYFFETLTHRCPLTSSVSVDDLIETFKHRASRLVLYNLIQSFVPEFEVVRLSISIILQHYLTSV